MEGDGGGSGGGRVGGNSCHLPRPLRIHPPLFNSANPWATTLEHLRSLYECEATGAVTTRTALLEGFVHDDGVHRYAFFETGSHGSCLLSGVGEEKKMKKEDEKAKKGRDASLNNLGYSPIPLDQYLDFIREIDRERVEKGKPFIVSVTGTPDEVAECYRRIARCQFGDSSRDRGGDRGGDRDDGVAKRVKEGVSMPLAMEVNLSCPNIPGKPPPAYEGEALKSYIRRITEMVREVEREFEAEVYSIPWGVKTPPYTHAGQFEMFISALRDCAVPTVLSSSASGAGGKTTMTCPVTFVTATNTLGTCLLLGNRHQGGDSGALSQVLPGLGIGGMAGAPLHPLALGNVATLRWMLDEQPETRHVMLLGIGGVGDAEGYKRMRSVGAAAVGVGTALGIKGLGVFMDIESGLGGVWEV